MTDALTLPAAVPAAAGLRAADIAEVLGLPRPTAQQVAIIESPLAPALVLVVLRLIVRLERDIGPTGRLPARPVSTSTLLRRTVRAEGRPASSAVASVM